MAGEIVAVWLADGYLLGHLLAVPGRKKAFVFAGGFVGKLIANLIGGESLYVSLSYTGSGMIEVCTAALLLPQIQSAKELIAPRTLLRFIICAGIIAPLASGAVAVLLLQGVFTTHPFSTFSNWVISDSLGFIIFTPVTLNVISGEWRSFLAPGNRPKSLALLGLVGGVTTLIFAQHAPSLLYWTLPPLALLAFNAELSTVVLGILLFIAIAVPFTVRGHGPLALPQFANMQDRILALQVFTLAALSIVLPITASQVERNRLVAMLIDGHRRFRALAEHAEEVIMQLSADGLFEYVSPRVKTVLGFDADELVGAGISALLLDADRARVQHAMKDAADLQASGSLQYRIRCKDDRVIWVRSYVASMPVGPNEEKPSMVFTLRDIDEQFRAEQKRDAEQRRLEDLAYVDSLTGLKNRRYFDLEFGRRCEAALQSGRNAEMAVLYIDVDFFKNYNDKYGHQQGDACLRAIARYIETTIRRIDVLTRYGGEEFVVLLQDCEISPAIATAERILENVAASSMKHEASPFGKITLSIGVAHTANQEGFEPERLLREADDALYEAKRLGRNRIVAHRHGANGAVKHDV
ncbi:Diguanylate cyclase with PAS/PAC sensor [Paraburkholderia ribeironis]|uniref:diguanylate cyclase n=2 Tax=Paraburkholderia ribeironis TaxID=1247936 RepID=A0A1N7SCJ2_9BURK|nr:Diguanylate cyclase with PAS/PAC sensor [Paraburkholderia ribeironis]